MSTTAPSSDGIPPHRYTAALAEDIELRWQDRWDEDKTFEAPNPAGPLAEPARVAGRPKLFILDMFPYPSGSGLHVGHPLGYIGTDVFGRYRRMKGDNVLHAIGYDAFGLPAEQYAIETGTHPRVTTENNVATMRGQLRRLGLAHDDRRSVSTTDESYYRWTQWIFLQIFESWYDADAERGVPIGELVAELESGARPSPDGQRWADLTPIERRRVDAHRLAYVAEAPVNWCPGLGTVLANEEVTADGRSDRGNFPVFKRNMRQWMMRITAYADRLIDDLDLLDWTDSIKAMQRNWIGRSHGANIHFGTPAGPLTVFTTRPDTLFGATFMVLAPEHPLVAALTTADRAADLEAYRASAAAKTDVARQVEDREKTGVFTGSSAINPATGALIQIWVADYVLMGYGTGAIMAVPCGDERDFEFARKFGLPIPAIQMPPPTWFAEHSITPSTDTSTWPQAYVGDDAPYIGSSNDSLSLDGDRSVDEAIELTNAWLAAGGHGEGTITYRLRDWLFARQRYWGEPFPIVYDDTGMPIGLPESMLPVTLPPLDDFRPTEFDPNDASSEPELPLGRVEWWASVELDLGDGPKRYQRDLNVMPQWAGSCWYELRYLDPTNENAFVDPEVERYWMGPKDEGHPGGVDLYVGGVEHAVLHLLYARFWHKVLFDLGHVSSKEPYHRLFNQGYILAEAFKDDREIYVDAFAVAEHADGTFTFEGMPVARVWGKMGKSLKNAVAPDEMYAEYGADTLRLYEMSMGPFDVSRPWSTKDVVGMYRFLQRVWRNYVDEQTGASRVTDAEPDAETLRILHRTIDGVAADYQNLRFNTAVAKLIELNNHLTKTTTADLPRAVAEAFAQMLSPLCPHVAEELWARMGHADTITYVPFPVADPALLTADTVEYPVQINGKVRSRIIVAADADPAMVEAAARADEKVTAALGGKVPQKVIVVPGRLVSVVV